MNQKDLNNEKRKGFHELLRAYTVILSKNVYFSTDYKYNNLKRLIKDEIIVVISGDKDSAIVIMDKYGYVKKMQEMIDKRMQEGVYAKIEDNTLHELKRFQDSLNRNFSKYEKNVTEFKPTCAVIRNS